MAQNNVSAQERALYFAQATRQTYQTLPTEKASSENDTIMIKLPKARLFSKAILEVEAVVTLKSTAAAIEKHPMSPYGILRRISLDLNNGFSPFIVSGKDMYLYSLNRLNPDVLNVQNSYRGVNYVENTASTTGKEAKIKFQVVLPVTLNDRDTVGLVLLQNEETSVTLTIDVGLMKDAYKLNTANNDAVEFKSLSVTPLLETYTVPPAEIARPDLSVLKIVQSKADTFAGGGQNVIKLQTGTIYRKMALYFEDSQGNPLTDADFSGNLELVFNTADVPISIKPSILAAKNHSELGFPLPDGVFLFDWSNQGVPNLGGTRDYIDTEKLTEFWIRFTTQKAGKLTVVPETLSRLI